MYEIRCLNDIKNLEGKVDDALIKLLTTDLHVIKDFADEDEEYTFEEYNTDYSDNGYIAILDGTETKEQLEQNLGLTGGLDEVVPEGVENYFIGDTKWSRMIVVYNDSYGMIFWMKNNNAFDSYAVPNTGNVTCDGSDEIF